MPEDDAEQSRLSGSSRTDSRELGTECDVESCDERVVGLDDGWEYNRGVVCSSCIEYRQRHHHWPDEDVEHCRECVLGDGGAVHDCPETSIDVLLRPGSDCPNCGFELAATDGGQQTNGIDPTSCPKCNEDKNTGRINEDSTTIGMYEESWYCRECGTVWEVEFEATEKRSVDTGAEHQFSESDLPELPIEDLVHLQRQYSLHGQERVVGWLRGKVALPTRLYLAQLDGKDVDEDAYYEWVANHYVDTDAAQTES